ncbi:MAG: CBS domain-containing protein [Roseovarius sp.]
MQVSQIMSRAVVSIAPDATVREAAEVLRRHDIGVLPVVEKDRAVGIVTDRDIVLNILPDATQAIDRPVHEAMSPRPVCCRKDQSVADAAALMGDEQIERLLVVDGQGRLVGVLSVGDIAVNASEELAGQAVGEICEDRNTGAPGHKIRPPG